MTMLSGKTTIKIVGSAIEGRMLNEHVDTNFSAPAVKNLNCNLCICILLNNIELNKPI